MTTRTVLDLIEDDIYRHDTGRIAAKLAEVTRDAWTGDSVVTILGTERARIITHGPTGGKTVRVGTVSETVDGDDWLPTALALWAEVPA